jgi:hypothetical protein
MEIHDVVMRLIGPVEPVGETRTDNQRLASLEQLTGLVDGLLEEIRGIAERHEHSHEYSVKRAADLCDKFLRTVAEEFAQSPAPAAPAPTSQWQDIATAPKDGPILAYNPVQGVYATRYDRGEWPHADWYSDDLGRDASLWYPRPTHWQPLPSAPLSAAPEDKPK